MKKLLLMLVVSLCVMAWRSPAIMAALGVAGSGDPASAELASAEPARGEQQAMSVDEFARLSHSDPHAARKFLASHTVQERGAVDKLMNLFAHGKYE